MRTQKIVFLQNLETQSPLQYDLVAAVKLRIVKSVTIMNGKPASVASVAIMKSPAINSSQLTFKLFIF